MLAPETLSSAPLLETPVPLRDKASAPTVMLFWSCSVVPLVMLLPEAVVPRAVAFWMFNTPALTVVVPV